MRPDITQFIFQAKRNRYARKYLSTEQETKIFYKCVKTRMENEKDFNWSEYTLKMESQSLLLAASELLKKEEEQAKKESKYGWVVRHLTEREFNYITVYPRKLMDKENRNWILEECEKVLNQKVKIVIERKKDDLLIATLERKEDEIQSEIIIQSENE